MEITREEPVAAEGRSRWAELVHNIRRYWFCYAMMSGTFILLITFAYYPAFSAFYHSFTNWDGFRPPDWVGWRNYRYIFTSTEIFGKGFRNMFILAAWQVFRSSVFPLLGAALLYRVKSEKTAYFFRLLFVLPIVVPGLVAILVWRQLYEPNVGLFNDILVGLGMQRLAWLNSPDTALLSLIFMGFPWIDGVGLLIYLAGFLAIPLEIIEAAIMDGAGTVRRFFSMELPLIVPQIRLIVILNVIGSFQDFGWQLLVTRGGPAGATTVPAWSMYKTAMNEGRYGVASAIGVVLFILIFTLTLINHRAIRTEVEYEAH